MNATLIDITFMWKNITLVETRKDRLIVLIGIRLIAVKRPQSLCCLKLPVGNSI